MKIKQKWEELKINKVPHKIFNPKKYQYAYRYDSFDIPQECDLNDFLMYISKSLENRTNKVHVYISGVEKEVSENTINGLKIKINDDFTPLKTELENISKQPTHEEIMTKWWFDDAGNWERVDGFNPKERARKGNYHCYRFAGTVSWVQKSWFIDRQSADTPPESS